MTDERIWQLWREANNVHSLEVDMAFARLVEAAVREECAQICDAQEAKDDTWAHRHTLPRGGEACALAIRGAAPSTLAPP